MPWRVSEADLVRHLVFAASYEGVKMIDTPLGSERKSERERQRQREWESNRNAATSLLRGIWYKCCSSQNKHPSQFSIIHTSILSHSNVRFTVISKYINCMGQSPSWESTSFSAGQKIFVSYQTINYVIMFKTLRHLNLSRRMKFKFSRSNSLWLILILYCHIRWTAVAQWLRCCATNRKVAGSIPAGVIGIFHRHKIFPIALWPWGRLSL